MSRAQVGAWLDSYRQDLKAALQVAAADGFRLLQPNTVGGGLNPRELGRSARRHLRRYLHGLGVAFDTVAIEFPGRGLAEPAAADERVDYLRRSLELCADLAVQQAVTRVGGFEDAARRPLAEEVLGAAADLADRFRIEVAVLPGPDAPATVARAVRATGCPALRLALDTATFGPVPEAEPVAGLVGAVHLRDVRRRGPQVEEVTFGQGDVDLLAWLELLEQSAPAASLAVRRDTTDAGVDAMRQGREYIEALLDRFAAH
jgi:sugar phosphate isomerase/epimerase